MPTDRKKLKDQMEGAFLGAAGIVDTPAAIRALNTRTREFVKLGTENAVTNVAQTIALGYQFRAVKVRGVGIATASNIATDNTDYNVFKFYKRAGATSTLVGSWNTHGGAQGAIALGAPVKVAVGTGLITNSDSDVAVGCTLDVVITKIAAGKLVDPGMIFSFDLEEV